MIIDFMLFLLIRTVNIAMKIYTSQSHHVKHYILWTIKIKNIRPEKLTDIDRVKKTPSSANFRGLND